MTSNVVYEILDSLAERYIPQGKHKILHVNSRELWVDLMVSLVERDLISAKLSTFTKYAANWETILIHKLSIQN